MILMLGVSILIFISQADKTTRMIDTLLQIFGLTLANKLFAPTDELTLKDVAQAVVDVGKDNHKHEKVIEAIRKELQGLAPHNLNPRIEEIYGWMHRHIQSEQQTFSELAKRQLYWNVALSCAAGLALLLSILCVLK